MTLTCRRSSAALHWGISEGDYNHCRDLYNTRIGAALVGYKWADSMRGEDGIHSTDVTHARAVSAIAHTPVKFRKHLQPPQTQAFTAGQPARQPQHEKLE